MSNKVKEKPTQKERKPVVGTQKTQERHDSEWQNVQVIRKDDAKGLRKALDEANAFYANHGMKYPGRSQQ